LQTPVYAPYYASGNPGHFTWLAAEGEEGPWMCAFAATDACGAEDTKLVTIFVGPAGCGDNNLSGTIELGDVVAVIHYLYKGYPMPAPVCTADVNCDGIVELGDLVYLLNYLFKRGIIPCFDCCAR
jgi:hypothetical protein